jgi:hypothetical protein
MAAGAGRHSAAAAAAAAGVVVMMAAMVVVTVAARITVMEAAARESVRGRGQIVLLVFSTTSGEERDGGEDNE